MKKIIGGLVGVVLALAVSFGVAVPQASAHNQSTYSGFYCAATRPNTNQTIYHSSAVDLQPGVVIYYCYGNYVPQDLDYQWWVRVNTNTQQIIDVPYGYQNCDLIDCSVTAQGYGH